MKRQPSPFPRLSRAEPALGRVSRPRLPREGGGRGQAAKVIIDTDPGVDDAIAILMALASPSIEIIGLTTVGGNVPLARTTRNSLALLEYIGRSDIPVARGSSRPVKGRFRYAKGVHSASGITRKLPNPKTTPIDETAVDFLARHLQRFPGQVTIIALGPLTNLARLLQRHPDALGLAGKLVVMGGAVNSAGNVTEHAEFNFYSDPAAAELVLSSGIPLTLVDLPACWQVVATREEMTNLRSRSLLGTLALEMLADWFRRDPARQRFVYYDPLTVAAALDPGVTTTRDLTLRVEASDPELWGKVTIEGETGPVALAHQVNTGRFHTLFRELLELE